MDQIGSVSVLDDYLHNIVGEEAHVRIAFDECVGRHLVATRDLAVGQVIARETQAISAPQSGRLCVGCQRRPAGSEGCPRCGWPLCNICADEVESGNLSSSWLHVECEILTPLREKRPWQTWRAPGAVLGVLRCLLLRKERPQVWTAVDCLQDNVTNLGRTPWLQGCLQNIIAPIQNDCGLNESVRTLAHIAGVLDTNSFAVSAADGMSARALYPLLCLMAHDCSPNTNRFFDSGVTTLIATRPIAAGERVLTSYTSLLWGTDARRSHLAATKFFHCTCRRCEQPSELDAEVTSLACHKDVDDGSICGGRRSSRRVGDDEVWECDRCGFRMPAAKVRTLHQMLAMTLGRTLELRDVEKAERWAEAHREVLAENHHFLLETRLLLVDLYAERKEGDVIENNRKRRRLCEGLLDITSRLDPGPTRMRGKLLCHLIESTVLAGDPRQKPDSWYVALADEAVTILRYDGLLRPLAERVRELVRARMPAT
ncbi:SET domain-containing protein SmydA-8-like isoform X1 [Amphibalanus amphitrite]|uniref:SET domain-containing protein SmydA-8-like isoform X1 n=1 Tax=Amphibalanus amphitrite TaxID=1232801 RepID=UPI001C91276B|nr:SET domain-containing protein SmydA-8-like isoform X1 [Amphibalanus amphitrite]